jgi:site-specific DNA-methyltransferase (adenine-specific)
MEADSAQPAYLLHRGDALDAYDGWPVPAAIISDGAYGVRGFPGDTVGTEGLADWYMPHVEAWSRLSGPATTLWFWNTEVGWATVHPLLARHGWDYVQTITWDKGLRHIAGNVNGKTIRRFPVVSEVCVFYQRRFEVIGPDGPMDVQRWMRNEWLRSGLALFRANEACGVVNAATRKYLTTDWLWYWPPGEMVERLAAYANAHGAKSGWPYYSLDGRVAVTAKEWDALRYRWRHAHGLTNVWRLDPLHGVERLKGTMRRAAPRVHNRGNLSAAHLNQKPLEFMRRILHAATAEGDVIWEPFGGLASGSVAAVQSGRVACVAEREPGFAEIAAQRLEGAVAARGRRGAPGTEAANDNISGINELCDKCHHHRRLANYCATRRLCSRFGIGIFICEQAKVNACPRSLLSRHGSPPESSQLPQGVMPVKGFRDFISRGNMIELAVAVVIGTAFTAVVTAVVNDLITPLIAAIGGQHDFSGLTFKLHGSTFKYGSFINALVAFLIIAAVVYFLIVSPMAKITARFAKQVEVTTRDCPECLSTIPIAASRCMYCTVPVAPVGQSQS